MAINKLVKLGWKGTNYEIKITMEVIDRLEDHVNLMRMAGQNASGDLRFSHGCKLIALVLNEAGVKQEDKSLTLQEEVYTNVFSKGAKSAKKMAEVVNEILSCIFPDVKKKSEQSKPKRKTTKK